MSGSGGPADSTFRRRGRPLSASSESIQLERKNVLRASGRAGAAMGLSPLRWTALQCLVWTDELTQSAVPQITDNALGRRGFDRLELEVRVRKACAHNSKCSALLQLSAIRGAASASARTSEFGPEPPTGRRQLLSGLRTRWRLA
jgi:hypothetical protein